MSEIKHKHRVGIKITQNAKKNGYIDSIFKILLRIPKQGGEPAIASHMSKLKTHVHLYSS